MMKKYVGITLITASMLVMGCSSDDDGSGSTTDGATTDGMTTDGMTTDGMTTDGMTTDGATTDGMTTDGATTDGATTDGATTDGATTDGATTDGATTDGATTDGATTDGATTDGSTDGGNPNSYRATSMMGVMAADARLTDVAAALNPDFDQPLDTANQGWTVFAPTNDALATAISGGAVVTGTVLQSHIYTQGAVASTDLVVGQTVSMSNNSVYTITSNGAGGLQIGGVDIIEADLAVDNGALHVIDGVLLPQ